IERKLLAVMIPQPEPVRLQSQIDVPLEPRPAPVRVPVGGLARPAEVLDLHLLEFPRPQGEVARVDLVAKTLPNLCDSKRKLHPACIDDILEIGKDALGRLGAEVRNA